ncbi:MAG: hypothetical protein KA234_03900 [Saprospiraceae bacterium]|nr:hypothetical protein [Saprospiraceae bacterium]
MREINFKCNEDNHNIENYTLFDIFMDTSISLQVINISNDELYFFHDKTFVIPYYKPYKAYPSKDDQTIIRYFDENKKEIFGRLSTVYLDSSSVNQEYFKPTFVDTSTYRIKEYDTLTINQKVMLPYFRDLLFITLNQDDCSRIRYIKFCLTKGKKKKNELFGISCSEFITVKHK